MAKIIYNKLIRDNIPEIIEKAGKNAAVCVLGNVEYQQALHEKLLEEVNEFLEDDTVEELADIVEVLYAILQQRCISLDEFEKIRLEKREKKGGFAKRLFLIETDDK